MDEEDRNLTSRLFTLLAGKGEVAAMPATEGQNKAAVIDRLADWRRCRITVGLIMSAMRPIPDI